MTFPLFVVSHGEIALPVGIAGIGFGQMRRNRQILLVGFSAPARSPCASSTSPIRSYATAR